ncbi:hypothetical protein CNMCM8927_003668 [Aspergillus lentulus]|uniref:FAD-binding domain-containing protein n=1 Tax=Aspergillus lentulus TaxID=293939 RepID=A0AAN6BKY4_ASPLE|nr:hypothetical protein CNMCM8060_003693 [Aspergillus lentulus]KAF4188050.1 hypothetical protein CNMCM8694_005162 [Aspergillus lentulus]KAF4200235.1 hypothetical protein CNMCM8927_003668 [Aspergillus lentulus]
MTPDIAIVGGGPCGLVLAVILEQKGIDYVIYECSAEDTPPRGRCLDIHRSSGQIALKEAGCFEESKKYARGGHATIHSMWDHKGNKLLAFGEGRDSPEIDRWQLRRVLLSSVPKEKIRWSTAVKSSSRHAHGDITLEFEDGLPPLDSSSWSEPTACAAKSDMLACQGPPILRAKMIWTQRQGDSHYRIDSGWQRPAQFPRPGELDLTNDDAVKDFLLQGEYFGCHTPIVHETIRNATGPSRMWPLHYFPVEHLNWRTSPGVAVVGDAAHVTTPFVGDGVNCAMSNALVLARKLEELGITTEAVAAYEQEVFPYAEDVISRSLISGKMFFEWDSPKGLMENFASPNRVVRNEGDY